MRKIKFRAFDERANSMFLVTELRFYGEDVFGSDPWLGEEIYAPALKSSQEITQFTCFTDSKGNEIFEGDILRQRKDSGAMFTVYQGQNGTWMVECMDKDNPWGQDILYRWAKVTEVVGNIFENKDLLRKPPPRTGQA